jgi:hypothetical protein
MQAVQTGLAVWIPSRKLACSGTDKTYKTNKTPTG